MYQHIHINDVFVLTASPILAAHELQHRVVLGITHAPAGDTHFPRHHLVRPHGVLPSGKNVLENILKY